VGRAYKSTARQHYAQFNKLLVTDLMVKIHRPYISLGLYVSHDKYSEKLWGSGCNYIMEGNAGDAL
jgi:hypothetical protein